MVIVHCGLLFIYCKYNNLTAEIVVVVYRCIGLLILVIKEAILLLLSVSDALMGFIGSDST